MASVFKFRRCVCLKISRSVLPDTVGSVVGTSQRAAAAVVAVLWPVADSAAATPVTGGCPGKARRLMANFVADSG